MLPVLSISYIRSFPHLSVCPSIHHCLDRISSFKVFVVSLQSVCLPPSVQCNFFFLCILYPSFRHVLFLVSHLSVCLTLTSCFGPWEWPPLINGCFFAFNFMLSLTFSVEYFSLHIFELTLGLWRCRLSKNEMEVILLFILLWPLVVL